MWCHLECAANSVSNLHRDPEFPYNSFQTPWTYTVVCVERRFMSCLQHRPSSTTSSTCVISHASTTASQWQHQIASTESISSCVSGVTNVSECSSTDSSTTPTARSSTSVAYKMRSSQSLVIVNLTSLCNQSSSTLIDELQVVTINSKLLIRNLIS